MKILWINGWGIPKQWMLNAANSYFPKHEHLCIHPTDTAAGIIQGTPVDLLVGYSLGANIILNLRIDTPALLLAPFLDLKKESALGGDIKTLRLMHMLRQLKNHPGKTLEAFYSLIGLSELRANPLPYDIKDLCWGLETMIHQKGTQRTISIPCAIGSDDPLLDTLQSQKTFPNITLRQKATHDPRTLFPSIKNAIR